MQPDPQVLTNLALNETLAALRARRRQLDVLIELIKAEQAMRWAAGRDHSQDGEG